MEDDDRPVMVPRHAATMRAHDQRMAKLEAQAHRRSFSQTRQYEFRCRGCGETFCDNDIDGLGLVEHMSKADGSRCGSTQVDFIGGWGG